ncbi:enoyl-CoA hydratase/isomerase family protein [Solimonas sp. K1W22B-7]|uniref:enoyl-CoA hydratase/isomerase family protein n=1 Tax=Solimonas sp. K1W22B-7 TaxID=2303331 RepID=UPI000E32FD70|nr:enoyl-CoA hydratase/isomerase family protein [Solimonas sp. K1W22B-7]AXQ31385.1 enoyl-CoA hydratase/isomerase family protein [Solimonas sp. K1W22B-7]
MADTAPLDSPVLFREVTAANGKRIGYAQLNAEKSLNALSLPMIRLLDPQLQRWSADPAIACVVLHGAGEKAFCAGGDVRSLHRAILDHQGPPPNAANMAFFDEEYSLDYRIHRYPKPLLVWGSGIVMGGGLGLMAGASHRVVTETSRVAMPEISIGLFPDVGGSWFLRNMPGRMGLFLALTGASINAHDLRVAGLADYFVRAADREAIFDQLAAADWGDSAGANRALLSQLLAGFAEAAQASLPASPLQQHAQTIEALTAGASLREVYAAITGYAGDNPWLKRAAATLAAGSPTTAALVWALRERASTMSLAEVFRMELVVALQCCAHPDFAEGVRALLIDKDNAPKWTPPTLAEVTPEWVAEHFRAPWTDSLASVGVA